MYIYKSCSEVTLSQMFEAFRQGFSDYFFPLTMTEEEFLVYFFGPEGNQLEYSYLAFDDHHPIGIILGGIRVLDGIKTMRCGTLGLGPDYRGKGISQKLFELHKEAAVREGCKQLFLEVIRENHRALQFYKKLGYLESTLLTYYTSPTAAILKRSIGSTYQVENITYDTIKSFRESLKACHINWQSDTHYYTNQKTDIYLGINNDNRLIGLIAITLKGKINFLWIEPEYRLQGIGNFLLYEATRLIPSEKIAVCIPGNALLEGFFRKLDFEKEKIQQYEMYLPL